jgi:uncharacterized protein YbaP (TraB family)
MKLRQMRIIAYTFLMLVLTVSVASAKNKYFFWEVSTDSTKVYLFGSIHIGSKDWYPFDKHIEDAFNTSDILATEIDFNTMDDATNALKRGVATDTIPLEKKLKPDNYKFVQSNLLKMGFPQMAIDRLRPWFVAITIQEQVMNSKGKYDALSGVDMYFSRLAFDNEKKTMGLEEMDFQFSLLEKIDEFADEYIESIITEKQDDKSMDTLVTAWQNGDDNTIDEMMNRGYQSENLVSLFDDIIYKRNETMAIKISELLTKKEKVFIVVGAGHLVGDKSIIKELNKIGKYKIKRI